jgi:hypothetical protein
MSLFGDLLRTTIHVVTIPVDVVKDMATLGGVLNDQSEPSTVTKIKKIGQDIEDLEDDVDRI